MKYPGKILNKASRDASVSDKIDKEKEFRVLGEVSNTDPDSQYHIITENVLKVFQKQLNATGEIPFINAHDMKQPLGDFVRAYMDDERLIAEASVLRNWNFGVDTNEFIKGVEATNSGIYLSAVESKMPNAVSAGNRHLSLGRLANMTKSVGSIFRDRLSTPKRSRTRRSTGISTRAISSKSPLSFPARTRTPRFSIIPKASRRTSTSLTVALRWASLN